MEIVLRWLPAALVLLVNAWLGFQLGMTIEDDAVGRGFMQFLLRAGIPVMVISIFVVLALSLSDESPRAWRYFWGVNALLPLLYGVIALMA